MFESGIALHMTRNLEHRPYRVTILGIGQTVKKQDVDLSHPHESDPDYALLDNYQTSNPLDKYSESELRNELGVNDLHSQSDMKISAMIADGSRIEISRTKLAPVLLSEIERLEQTAIADDAHEIIMVDCTGDFPELQKETLHISVVMPGHCLWQAVKSGLARKGNSNAKCRKHKIAILVPIDAQLEPLKQRWLSRRITHGDMESFTISPLATLNDFADMGARLRGSGHTLVIMDCMGYSYAQAAQVRSAFDSDVETVYLAKEAAIDHIIKRKSISP